MRGHADTRDEWGEREWGRNNVGRKRRHASVIGDGAEGGKMEGDGG